MSNPHMFVSTQRLLEDLPAEGQAQATLALAYEQRTANLIALFGEGFAGTGLHYGEKYAQIKERLGLSDAET